MENNDVLEFTGDTVDSAIASGIEHLGVGPSDVLVEVLEEPSRGVFGIGARPARVRLKLLRQPVEPPPEAEVQQRPDTRDVMDEDDEVDAVVSFDSEEATVAHEVLSELLQHMEMRATIEVSQAEPASDEDEAPWVLDVQGPNASVLVGRRGETLAALQYITRLIVSRRLERRANIIVDAGGYKMRRTDRLESLAERMADEAVRTARSITLEPMPPNERRIIHMTLRDRPDVETQSSGEGDSRKVTIIPLEP